MASRPWCKLSFAQARPDLNCSEKIKKGTIQIGTTEPTQLFRFIWLTAWRPCSVTVYMDPDTDRSAMPLLIVFPFPLNILDAENTEFLRNKAGQIGLNF
jgi:hypothetical protein